MFQISFCCYVLSGRWTFLAGAEAHFSLLSWGVTFFSSSVLVITAHVNPFSGWVLQFWELVWMNHLGWLMASAVEGIKSAHWPSGTAIGWWDAFTVEYVGCIWSFRWCQLFKNSTFPFHVSFHLGTVIKQAASRCIFLVQPSWHRARVWIFSRSQLWQWWPVAKSYKDHQSFCDDHHGAGQVRSYRSIKEQRRCPPAFTIPTEPQRKWAIKKYLLNKTHTHTNTDRFLSVYQPRLLKLEQPRKTPRHLAKMQLRCRRPWMRDGYGAREVSLLCSQQAPRWRWYCWFSHAPVQRGTTQCLSFSCSHSTWRVYFTGNCHVQGMLSSQGELAGLQERLNPRLVIRQSV